MRVTTISTPMTCPRCDAPIRGDYKYCPECAYRLRRRGPERTEPTPGGPGSLILGLAALLLLGAGIFVGTTVLRDTSPVAVTPPAGNETAQTIRDIHGQLVPIPKGVANYDREEVLVAPPVDAAFAGIFRRMAPEQRAHLLDLLGTHPRVHARWARMLSLFYDATIDLLEEKTKYVPIYTRAFKCMRYEVSRGQWKEFLRHVERDTTMFSNLEWVNWLRRGWAAREPGEDAASYRDRLAVALWNASSYREAWWNGVLESYKARDNLRRQKAWELLKNSSRKGGSEDTGEEDEETWEVIPPAAPPERPAWLDIELGATDAEIDELAAVQAQFSKMTDAQAFYLLVPPEWIRVQADGSLIWGDTEANDDLPVTGISWYDAHMFTIWAREHTGIGTLRLPSWREWQRVFHGGEPRTPTLDQPDDFGFGPLEGRKWPWGNEVDPHGCNNLNFGPNAELPVLRGVREPYGWKRGQTKDGVLNMAGNAAEWTCNVKEKYVTSGDQFFVEPAPRKEEGRYEWALACGGSYLSGIDDCSVDSMELLRKIARRIDVGFRLVADSLF